MYLYNDSYSFISSLRILDSFIQETLLCPQCKSDNVCLLDDLSKRQGFSYWILLKCKQFLFEKIVYTSEPSEVKPISERPTF